MATTGCFAVLLAVFTSQGVSPVDSGRVLWDDEVASGPWGIVVGPAVDIEDDDDVDDDGAGGNEARVVPGCSC